MRFTLTVRSKESGNVFTHVAEFHGDDAPVRAQSALNAAYDGWVIRDGNELIVMTLAKVL